mmetsp:Transcript_106655/g.340344  ORF Transcript_106655/g.340344 Transcript_106655/m.340344 type:complete len:203 (-) Transcript_106655:3091-3699(-)
MCPMTVPPPGPPFSVPAMASAGLMASTSMPVSSAALATKRSRRSDEIISEMRSAGALLSLTASPTAVINKLINWCATCGSVDHSATAAMAFISEMVTTGRAPLLTPPLPCLGPSRPEGLALAPRCFILTWMSCWKLLKKTSTCGWSTATPRREFSSISTFVMPSAKIESWKSLSSSSKNSSSLSSSPPCTFLRFLASRRMSR